jgi:glutamyl-tRNA reductase
MPADILVVGLSYKTAPLDIRERLAFPDTDMGPALAALLELPSVGEAVVLSTCNRVEVYAAGRAAAAGGEIRRFLAERRGVSDELLAGHLYERTGEGAVRHIFRVASSLDSLVVGESQILGQLKSAYGAASQAGSVGPLLGRCLERAFGVAKRVRAETAIARGAANVSSVAVELAKRVFGELNGKVVLIVGAGKMSDLAARHLRADGAAEILVTNRSPERAAELAAKVEGKARPWDELEALFGLADVVISSTGAREPIVSRDFLKRVMKARRHRPIFIIDIAVPRDIEPAAGKLDDVYLFDIDDLEKVVADNQAERRKEAGSAERIVDGETGEFLRWLRSQGVVPTIKELRERFTQIAQAEAQKLIDKDPAAEAMLRRLADAIVAKLVHSPTMALRAGDDAEALVLATRRLFSLEEEKK